MPIDTVDISLPLMSTYTGNPTMFMNEFPKSFALGENALFHHFRIFCYKQQKHEATGLLGPGCALTYVNIYKMTCIYNTYTVGNKL